MIGETVSSSPADEEETIEGTAYENADMSGTKYLVGDAERAASKDTGFLMKSFPSGVVFSRESDYDHLSRHDLDDLIRQSTLSLITLISCR